MLQQIAAVCVFFEAERPTMKNLGRCQGTHPLGAAQVREPEPRLLRQLGKSAFGLGRAGRAGGWDEAGSAGRACGE